jgi:hypothetical protein
MPPIVKSKKSQTAMEFMMTYGWAIMLVLVAVAALTYFGFFHSKDVKKIIPSKCDLGSGLTCVDSVVEPARIGLIVRNENRYPINITNTESNIGNCQMIKKNTVLQPAEEREWIFLGCNFEEEDINKDVNITYNIIYSNGDPGPEHTAGGLISKVVADSHIKSVKFDSPDVYQACMKAELNDLKPEDTKRWCQGFQGSDPNNFALCCPSDTCRSKNPMPDNCYCCSVYQ